MNKQYSMMVSDRYGNTKIEYFSRDRTEKLSSQEERSIVAMVSDGEYFLDLVGGR